MKINSKFANKCPGCGKAIIGQEGRGYPWECNLCPKPICEWCYSPHTEAEHPEQYAAKIETSER